MADADDSKHVWKGYGGEEENAFDDADVHSLFVYIYIYIYICMYVCMIFFIYICMYVCMYMQNVERDGRRGRLEARVEGVRGRGGERL